MTVSGDALSDDQSVMRSPPAGGYAIAENPSITPVTQKVDFKGILLDCKLLLKWMNGLEERKFFAHCDRRGVIEL
ncbi:hypothetical protein [Nostoc sp.]|uniref:hypothetical protein n=1 Tax=Nostoc sp. TaxID=1180 RepID=UPI002FF795A2